MASSATRIQTASRVSPVEIRTPPALAAIAKKFAPVVLQDDDTPVPPSNADYFGRMNLPTNVELDSGNYHNIDVQFDTRFILNYIMYHVTALAPELNFKGHPYFSPLSYIGYCLHLLYALMLACDVTFRSDKSWHAARFMTDQERKDLYEVLLNCHMPTFLSDLFLELSPVYDPRRNNLLFVPSLAGFSFEHDFGRTIPPSLFYAAHHMLASTRTNKDPNDVIDDCMSLNVITAGATTYKVSNFLGTWYASGHHDNWLNRDFLAFFNPLVGRFLTQRPTFARIHTDTETLAIDGTGNPYTAYLLASDENTSVMTTLLTAMSTFILANDPKAPKLGSVLATLSGTLLLSYSIEPPTLPTWTAATYTQETDPADVNDATFAREHNFLADEPVYTNDGEYPDDTTNGNMQLYHFAHGAPAHTAARTPYKHIVFNARYHLTPYVMYFQPYDVSPSSLGLTIAAGIKIEHGDIAGFAVNIEQPESSLDDNNAQILQSAIRLNKIIRVNANTTAGNNASRVVQRDHLDRTKQGIMTIFRSIAKSVFPYLDGSAIHYTPATLPRNLGLTEEAGHYSLQQGFNVKAGTEGKFTAPDHSIYLWSSYRYVHKKKNPAPADISMLATLRTFYGSNVTLSRSKNPVLMIPH
ncbi:capsid protein [Heterobasidion partitivirus 8]|uniref:Capsid protein n=1 Tax=Heterobasidion partitivirus 8 TaxID=1249677 RepID=K7U6Q4_9VIRU|nr:capsid protein [Heterobasidion partitivirus 8]AFW17811.1 capsid protein [Heterobasidion partitivirus 8]